MTDCDTELVNKLYQDEQNKRIYKVVLVQYSRIHDRIVAFRAEVAEAQRRGRFDLKGFTLKYTRGRIAAGLLDPVEYDSGSEGGYHVEYTRFEEDIEDEPPAMEMDESQQLLKKPQQRYPSVLRGVPNFETEDVTILACYQTFICGGQEGRVAFAASDVDVQGAV